MHARISALDPAQATGRVAELFASVKAKLGAIPNLFRTFGHSPAVLEGYVGFSGALANGVLPAPVREQLALAVAEANGCDYCLAAHSLLGKGAGLSPADIESARRGDASDPKVHALLQFARAVVAQRGAVSDDVVATARAAGASDAELVEVVAHVAVNVLTNYTNNVARTAVDFPRAKPLSEARAA